jgi:predicted nucleotidyltransferase
MAAVTGGGGPESLTAVLTRLRASLPQVQARYHIRSLALFGSYVREQQTDQSDLDVLVEFDEPPSLLEFVRLERELSSLLGVRVDLVMKSALKPTIGTRIQREIVPL